MVAVTTLGALTAAPPRRPGLGFGAQTRTTRLVAGAVTGVAVALAVLTIPLHLHNGDTELTSWWYGNVALPLSLAVPAYLIATRRPANPVGWLLCAAALTEAMCAAGREYLVIGLLGGYAPGWLWGGWFADSLYIPAIVTLPVTLLLFPDGQPVSARFRWLVPAVCVAGLVAWLSYLFTGDVAHVRGHDLANPAAHLAPQSVTVTALAVAMPALILGLAASFSALVVRHRRARGEQRQQITWVVWAGGLLAVELATEFIPGNPASPVTGAVAVALFSAAVAIGILRHQMFDIDVVVNRTLVFVALTVAVVGGYLVCVAAFATALGEPVDIANGLLPTAVIAVAFAPVRQRLQALVDRLMYGERRNPYGVMTRLGAQLETRAPRTELMVVVETVAQTLKLPYVAIVDSAGSVLAAAGVPGGAAIAQPLVYQGEPLGELRVEPRTQAARFGRDERRLLTDLSRQVAAAVHAVSLSADLQASRRRLVTAKEEERRRLRRDLHDGLGPKLAAVGLRLDGARSLITDAPDQASEALRAVKNDIRSTIEDIRQLVYDLRPPALDELGLVGAVRECAARLEPPSGPVMTVSAPAALPTLPAAVEVAAYRIVNEALTNVVRHAGASRCEIRVEIDDQQLVLVVDDDGSGIATAARHGVGSQSMKERAAEIGGLLVVETVAGRGTRVIARLPLGGCHE